MLLPNNIYRSFGLVPQTIVVVMSTKQGNCEYHFSSLVRGNEFGSVKQIVAKLSTTRNIICHRAGQDIEMGCGMSFPYDLMQAT